MEGPGLWQLPKEDLFWFSMFRHSGYVSQSPHAVQHYTFPNHLSHPVHLPNSSLRWGDSPCELLKAYDGKDTSDTAIVGGLKLLVWFAFSHIAEFQVLQPCRLHVWSWLSVTCSKKLISLYSLPNTQEPTAMRPSMSIAPRQSFCTLRRSVWGFLSVGSSYFAILIASLTYRRIYNHTKDSSQCS